MMFITLIFIFSLILIYKLIRQKHRIAALKAQCDEYIHILEFKAEKELYFTQTLNMYKAHVDSLYSENADLRRRIISKPIPQDINRQYQAQEFKKSTIHKEDDTLLQWLENKK